MCIIASSFNNHEKYRLILAANRDEFFERPTASAQWWEDDGDIFGGRDLLGGGTWLAVHRSGRLAAITNYRDPVNIRKDAKTRGELTKNFLKTDLSAGEYIESIAKGSGQYNGFNLMLYDENGGSHFSNYENIRNDLQGVHVLSNALLDTPWPKVTRLKDAFKNVISSSFSHETLLDILADDQLANDEELPSTGIPHEWEKAISSICIKTPNYGTCCSTVVTIDHQGNIEFTEKLFPVGGRTNQTIHKSLQVRS